jgi:hypothetical protein
LGSLYDTEFVNAEPDLNDHLKLQRALRERGTFLPAAQASIVSISKCEPKHVLSALRPARSGGVRIELERVRGHTIIHNYGHGGSGVTVSWGTVEDAIGLLTADSA